MELGPAYAILGLGPGASLDEVRHAYRGAMRRLHPDTGSGDLNALQRAGRAYRAIAAAQPVPVRAVEAVRASAVHVDVYA
jgi:curved DNA-binding protein CbpA